MIRSRAALGVTVAVAALAVSVSVPVTLATFSAKRAASASFGTATLRPPTALTATASSASASLAWTPSTSSSATGYRLLRSATSGSGYAQVATITPISAAAGADTPGVGTWYYVLDTYLGAWTSAASNEASVTLSSQTSTATVGCDPASQAPETVDAGNNDGYELNPGNACSSGGGYATDSRTGTDNANSCTDTGKDRHRFWGYAFSLPGTVTSVDGITLTLEVGQSNHGGQSSVCAQLSWDGGTTWTAPKRIVLASAALSSYTAGSTSDTWGHTWSPAQLATTAFRVRITDVATTSNKDFRLDYLGAAVTYTP